MSRKNFVDLIPRIVKKLNILLSQKVNILQVRMPKKLSQDQDIASKISHGQNIDSILDGSKNSPKYCR